MHLKRSFSSQQFSVEHLESLYNIRRIYKRCIATTYANFDEYIYIYMFVDRYTSEYITTRF